MNILEIKDYEELQKNILDMDPKLVRSKQWYKEYYESSVFCEDVVFIVVKIMKDLNQILTLDETQHIVNLVNDYRDFIYTKIALNDFLSIDVYLKHENEFKEIRKTLIEKQNEFN